MADWRSYEFNYSMLDGYIRGQPRTLISDPRVSLRVNKFDERMVGYLLYDDVSARSPAPLDHPFVHEEFCIAFV